MRFLIFKITLLLFCHVAIMQADDTLLNRNRSLRVNLILRGDAHACSVSVHSVCSYPHGGSGMLSGFNSNQGEYRITQKKKKTHQMAYQDGFSSLFDEWATSDFEGKSPIDFQQVIVMPMPLQAVELIVDKRNREGAYIQILKQDIVPDDVPEFVSPFRGEVKKLAGDGSAGEKVDVLVVAEGYTEAQKAKFEADAKRFANYFLLSSPYAQHAGSIAIRSVFHPSKQSGCIHPLNHAYPETVLGASFNTFGSERYLQTLHLFDLADYAAVAPHDLIVVLVNSPIYGGGGVFNSFAIGSADNSMSMAVLMHEIGHAFGGLADEYFDSDVPYSDFYSATVEPWEPNITTLVDFDSKWKNDVDQGQARLVEGAGYAAKGIYRSQNDCLMKSLSYPLCRVCQKAVAARISLITGNDK